MPELLSRIIWAARELTPREFVSEAALRTGRGISRGWRRVRDKGGSTYVSDAELNRSLGVPIGEALRHLREVRAPLLPGLADPMGTAVRVRELFPESAAAIVEQAREIASGRVRIFERRIDADREVDWHADPFSGVTWPVDHYTRVPLVIQRGADVRVTWEMNRLHHLVTLGQAFALTRDEAFADCLFSSLASWREKNPPRFGVNWTVAMEVAIRAVNVIVAVQLLRGSRSPGDAMLRSVLKLLLEHGRFIRTNLEYSRRGRSNHYLADLIGLFAISVSMPGFRESAAWLEFSRGQILQEIQVQVLSDGVDYEGSTAYHRLVLEMFALCFASEGLRPTLEAESRLAAMFDFVKHYLKPDGTAPSIGDSDDGRLLRFGPRSPLDHSYLLPLGAVLTHDSRFKLSGSFGAEALWWLGEGGLARFESLPMGGPPRSRAFPAARILVQRDASLYAVIDCGDHGMNGRGSHAHSDALSVEVFANGTTFLRDPGTFVYTASEDERNEFRSTAYHNTVRVDRRDISLIEKGNPFLLGPNVKPVINRWETSPELDILDAEHHAYTSLASPVAHRRIVLFDKVAGFWIVRDLFTGEGTHLFEAFYNFDSGVEVNVKGERIVARGPESLFAINAICERAFAVQLEPRWISPAYHERGAGSVVTFVVETEVPFEFRALLIPYLEAEESRIDSCIERAAGLI